MTLKVSLQTRILPQNMDTSNGYGTATEEMLASWTRCGIDWEVNAANADVTIMFDQPHHWKPTKSYNIIYHPWESTKLKKGWGGILNSVDEVWTPSALIGEWYKNHNDITAPVFVYEHGIEPEVWTPVERKPVDKIKFLHVGGQAVRKGLKETRQAFNAAFPRERSDVELTLKIISKGWKINWLPRTEIINGDMSETALVKLFHTNHVYIYPSWGEGFGLTPLQAMVTGMPTITLPGWAPYERFMDENLKVDSKLWPSPWPMLHPGNMFKPNFDDIVDAMRYAYNNYNEASDFAHSQVADIVKFYDWDRLTRETFDALENRLKNL